MDSLLRKYIDIIEEKMSEEEDWESSPVASSALTPQQQALAKSAGFATNKAQAGELAKKNLAAIAPTVPGTLKAGDGSAVVDGSGAPVQAGTQPAPAAPAVPAAPEAPAEVPAPAPAAPAVPAAPEAPAEVPAPAPAPAPSFVHKDNMTPADQADFEAKQKALNAQTAADAAAPAPAAPAPAAPAPAAPAPAAAPNYDAMPFGQAFGAARKAGAKDFTWKGKKYAMQMAPKQAATPNPAGTVKNAAGGQTTTNAGGAATSVTRNSRPVVPGSLRAQQQANQAAQPATESYMKDLNAMRRIAGLKDSGT